MQKVYTNKGEQLKTMTLSGTHVVQGADYIAKVSPILNKKNLLSESFPYK